MRKIRIQLRPRGGRIAFFKYAKGSHKKKGDVLTSLVAWNIEREICLKKHQGPSRKDLRGKYNFPVTSTQTL